MCVLCGHCIDSPIAQGCVLGLVSPPRAALGGSSSRVFMWLGRRGCSVRRRKCARVCFRFVRCCGHSSVWSVLRPGVPLRQLGAKLVLVCSWLAALVRWTFSASGVYKEAVKWSLCGSIFVVNIYTQKGGDNNSIIVQYREVVKWRQRGLHDVTSEYMLVNIL